MATSSSSHHVKRASAARLPDLVGIWSDSVWILSLVLLALIVVTSLLHHSVIDFHSPIINLSHVVVFNGTSSRRRTAVNNSSSTEVGAEFISVETSVDEGTALAKKFFKILDSDNTCIDVSDFYFSLGKSALDYVDLIVVGLLLVALTLSLVCYFRCLRISPSQRTISLLQIQLFHWLDTYISTLLIYITGSASERDSATSTSAILS